MFRKHKLSSDGARAQAVVIAAKKMGGGFGEAGANPIQYDLELQVHFEDGSLAEFSCRVGGALSGTDLSFSEGDVVPVRYDPADRRKIELDEAMLHALKDGKADAFKEAAVARSELELSAETADKARTSPPTNSELQAISDAWDAAMAKARGKIDAYQQAKSAGDAAAANRQLAEGALANAEQQQLGEQLKRLRALRPDWKSAQT